MSIDQQLTPARLRAMTKEQVIAAYMALDTKWRKRELAFRNVVAERNRLSAQNDVLKRASLGAPTVHMESEAE